MTKPRMFKVDVDNATEEQMPEELKQEVAQAFEEAKQEPAPEEVPVVQQAEQEAPAPDAPKAEKKAKGKKAKAPKEAVVKVDATPLQGLADAMAEAAGLPSRHHVEEAKRHFEREPAPVGEQRLVALSALVESPHNPRRRYEGIEELAESIKKVGILQPLLVRTTVTGDVAGYEIVAGHRRARAAKLAGLDEVPCEVRELSDVQALEVQLVENVQRRDLSAIEEAEAYKGLMDRAGYNADQVAAKAGKSRGWVYARLKLLDLCPEGQKAMEAGTLAPTVATALARIPNKTEQTEALKKLEGLTTREALDALQRGFTVNLKGAPFDRKDDMLIEGAGACTACPKRSGSGIPGVFDDLQGKDICTDTTCYAAKCRASWEAKATRFESQGAEVLSIEEGRKLFRQENSLTWGGKYVLADEPVAEDSKKRTWAELLEKVPQEHQPKLFVAPDLGMAARRMYVHADALHAVAEHLGLKWAEKGKARKQERAARAEPAVKKEEAVSRAVRESVAQEIIFAAAAKAKKEGLSVGLARMLARAHAEEHGTLLAYLAERPGFNEKKPEAWFEEANTADCIGYLTAALLSAWAGGTWGGFEDELSDVAKLVGMDVAKAVAARAQAEEAEKEKAAKK